MLKYTTDSARPGLVALYDIRPGNGAGQFLQPWSPHGAAEECIFVYFFVLFVHVTVRLSQVVNNIVHTCKARCSLFVLKVKGKASSLDIAPLTYWTAVLYNHGSGS